MFSQRNKTLGNISLYFGINLANRTSLSTSLSSAGKNSNIIVIKGYKDLTPSHVNVIKVKRQPAQTAKWAETSSKASSVISSKMSSVESMIKKLIALNLR